MSLTQSNLIVSHPGVVGTEYAPHACVGPYIYNHVGCDEYNQFDQYYITREKR